jgi:hypothetical protein
MCALTPKAHTRGVNPLASLLAHPSQTVGVTLKFDLLAVHAERAHPMVANFRVNCVCGAIYDVIEASGYSKDHRSSKCVLCDRELFPPDKAIG